MLETTSQPTSTDQGTPSSTAAVAGGASPTSAPTTPPTATPAATGAPPAQTAASPAKRPDGVPESFWDKDKGEVKVGDWANAHEELRAFKAAEDARKAALPAQPDLYKPELPKDLKLPAGMEIKTDDPLYLEARAFAHASGLSQEQFSGLIGAYAKQEAAKHEALQAAIKARDESLGANGPKRVDDLNGWFKATFGEDVGKQFSQTLFTGPIIKGFEQIKEALSRQGVTKFSGVGREPVEGRADGLPDNWDQMKPMDRRQWQLSQQSNRGRAA